MSNQAVLDSGVELAYGCSAGYGGALCLLGTPGSSVTLQQSIFLNNSASYGGGASVHTDSSCSSLQLSEGCFSAYFNASCKFYNNTAAEGAGGALFWTRPGNLNISCSDGHSLLLSHIPEADHGGLLDAFPCSDWTGNQATGAGYGGVAASTSFYLQPSTPYLPYYTSNALLPLKVFAQVRFGTTHG